MLTITLLFLIMCHYWLPGKVKAYGIYALWLLIPWQLTIGLAYLHFIWQKNDYSKWHFPLGMKIVWIVGMLGVGIAIHIINKRFRQNLYQKRQLVLSGNYPVCVYVVPGLDTSCVMRLRRENAIYLSEEVNCDDEMRHMVIAHELAHLRHHDLVWAKVRMILICIMWFHPLIWVAALLSKQDCEIACDEEAIRLLGENERKKYGRLLLELVTDSTKKEEIFYMSTTMSASKRELKNRIQRIADGEKKQGKNLWPSFLIGFIVAIIPVMAVCKIAQPMSAKEVIADYFEAVENCDVTTAKKWFPGEEPWFEPGDALFHGYGMGKVHAMQECKEKDGATKRFEVEVGREREKKVVSLQWNEKEKRWNIVQIKDKK